MDKFEHAFSLDHHDVTSREGDTAGKVNGSMHGGEGGFCTARLQCIMGKGHMGPPLKTLPSRNLVGRR